jgi:hypothetical protein
MTLNPREIEGANRDPEPQDVPEVRENLRLGGTW